MLAVSTEKFETRRPWRGQRGVIPSRARAIDGFANFPSFSQYNPFGKRCSTAAEWELRAASMVAPPSPLPLPPASAAPLSPSLFSAIEF